MVMSMTDVLPPLGADALLIDEFGDELLGSGLINSLGLVSALLLVQEQSSQGIPTLSPARLALDALSMNLLNLEPALASLSSSVPAGLLASLQGEAEALPWSDLLGQAQTLVNELVEGVSSLDGLPLEALGLESLATLLDDLQVLDAQLPDVLDITSLAGAPGVLAGLTESQLPLDVQGESVSHGAEVASPILDQESDSRWDGVDEVLTTAESGVAPVVSATGPATGSTEQGQVPSPVVNVPETLAPVTAPVQDGVATVLPPVENLVGVVPGVVEPVVDGVVAVVDQTTDVVETVVDAVDGATDLVSEVVQDLLTSPGDLPETLVDGVDQVVDVVDEVVGETTELVDDVTEVVNDVVTDTVDNLLDVLEPVTDLLAGGDLGDADGLLEPVTDLLAGGDLGDTDGLLEPVTDLLAGGGEGASLIDDITEVVDQPQSLLDGLSELDPVTDVVADLGTDLPIVDEVESGLPLVSDLTAGTLPLVQAPSDEEGGGGLLGTGLLG